MRTGSIRLTEEQDKDLTQYVKRRLRELEADNKDRIEADKKADLDYRLQKQARAIPGTIFDQSNFPCPLTSWVVDHFSARSEDELLGRDPCVSFKPQGPADDDVARGVNRLAQYKFFDQGTVKTDLQKGMYPAFAHRALILKSVYKEDYNEWEEYDLNILHDRRSGGQPVEILNHGFVIQDVDGFTPVTDMVTGAEVQQLDADPTFKYDPANHYFQPSATPVRFRERLFAAPKSVQVDSDRFMAPSDARSLNEADILTEEYDKSISWVMERFCERPWLTAAEYLTKLSSETAEKKTRGRRAEFSKENLRFDHLNKKIGIVEIWLERDVLGWGRPQKLVLWYDKKRDLLISYDFAVKLVPQGRQPFTAIPIWQQDDVWWGYSIPEMLRPIQEYIDLQFNRHSHRNAVNSNPIVGEHPDAIEGEMSFADMKPFQTVTLAEGKTIRDWIETFVFPNADQDTQVLIDKAIYWVNFWLGISNIARGDYSDIPQNTTMGGQEATLKEASKLSRRWSRRLIVGLEEHLTNLVRLLLATMDEFEAYTFLEGDKRQAAVLELSRVGDLLIDASLVWNSEQNSRTVEMNRLTLEIIQKYADFLVTAPWMIPMVRPVLKSSLFMLGHDDVDALLPLPPYIPPMPFPQPVSLGGVTTSATPVAGANPDGTIPFEAPGANSPAPLQPQPQPQPAAVNA